MKRLMRVLCGFAIALSAGATSAGTFSISPVRVSLDAHRPVSMLTLSNTGDEPVVVQLEIKKWSNRFGQDEFEATRDLLASPPIFTVPPKGRQIIRVGLRGAISGDNEASYRLFVREVPPPPKPGQQGLQMAVHMSLPVFVSPGAHAVPAVDWQLRRDPEGRLVVRALNRGRAHMQISRLELTSADGEPLDRMDFNQYLLIGQDCEWTLPLAVSAGAKLRLLALTDVGAQRMDLIVD
jgi:fimbrial chaperone protein